MALVRWNPAVDMLGIQGDINRMFDNFFGLRRTQRDMDGMRWTPRVNIEENDDRFELTAEIPGMEKNDINIDLRDHVLLIKGEKKFEKEKENKDFQIFERCYGEFARTFTLPENVDTDKIEAEYKNGILMINIPKIEQAQPKEIKVKVK
jgi:HSP20 family protein